jgi:ribosomal protein L40E
MFDILNLIENKSWVIVALKCAIIIGAEVLMCYTAYQISKKKGYSGIKSIIATLLVGVVFVICIGFLPAKEYDAKKECVNKTINEKGETIVEKEVIGKKIVGTPPTERELINGWVCPKCGSKNAKKSKECYWCGLHKG